MLGEDQQRLHEAGALIEEINLGATAIGTGINSHPGYAPLVCKHLVALSKVPVKTAENLVEATQDCGAFVQLSGVLKRIAVKLSKTCNDLRLLSSGPRAGLGEINLPAVQAGSSIMPGKINPVIPEVVNQIAFEVIGNDMTVTMAAEAGQLQLNAFEPIIAYSLFRSIPHLQAGLPRARAPVRDRHHGEPRATRRDAAQHDRHRDRAQSLHRLREVERAREGGARDRARRRRPRPREGLAVAGRARPHPVAGEPDRAARRCRCSPMSLRSCSACWAAWDRSRRSISSPSSSPRRRPTAMRTTSRT